jgi:hypothetical protein
MKFSSCLLVFLFKFWLFHAVNADKARNDRVGCHAICIELEALRQYLQEQARQ